MGHAAAAQRGLQESLKFVPAHLDGAEPGQMAGDELGVEQGEASISQPRHQIDQRDLARVAGSREHALAEKRAAEMHAVESAGEHAVLPHLDRVAMAKREQFAVETPDARVDPGRAAS
jgi:hypothetical protein